MQVTEHVLLLLVSLVNAYGLSLQVLCFCKVAQSLQVPLTPLAIAEKFGYVQVAGHVLRFMLFLSECKLRLCVLKCVLLKFCRCQ